MSGFEVAGIVLAVIPLVIEGVEKYSELAKRLGLFYQIRLEHSRCLRDLRFHRTVLASHLRQLLLPLVVDDAHVNRLLADPGGEGWKEAWLDDSLRDRLGESYELYFEYITGMRGVAEELKHELALDSDAVQEKLSTPKAASTSTARLKNAMSKEGREFQLYKAKFSNRESARKELFAQLQSYNDRLEKLLSSSDRDAQLRQQAATARQGTSIDPALCHFWKLSSKLFRALASAWSCGCQEQHSTRLLLEHRTLKKAEFSVVFATSSATQWQIHKTRITQQMEGTGVVVSQPARKAAVPVPAHQPKHRQAQPVKSSMKTRNQATYTEVQLKPPLSITLTAATTVKHEKESKEDGQPTPSLRILSLCDALGKGQDKYRGYVAKGEDDDCRFYLYSVSRQQLTNGIPSVTLDQILRGEVQPRPTRRQRYTLALILASSFLQYMDTQWLPAAAWQKTDIIFCCDGQLVTDASGVARHSFRLDQPHLIRSLEMPKPAAAAPAAASDDDEDETPSSAPTVIAQSLHQLGIVLLELCFGKPLEEQPCRKEWRAGDTEAERRGFDLLAAQKWQYEVGEEAGADYSDAVEWCLGSQQRADQWRQEMLRKVVQPLQRCQDYLMGSGQRTAT